MILLSQYFQNAITAYDANNPPQLVTPDDILQLRTYVEKHNAYLEDIYNDESEKALVSECRLTDASINYNRANGQFLSKSSTGFCRSASIVIEGADDPCVNLPDALSCILSFDASPGTERYAQLCRWVAQDSVLSLKSYSLSPYKCIQDHCNFLNEARCELCQVENPSIDCNAETSPENTTCIPIEGQCGINSSIFTGKKDESIEMMESACKAYYQIPDDCNGDSRCQWNPNPRNFTLSNCAKENQGDQGSFHTLLSDMNFLSMAYTRKDPNSSKPDLDELDSQYEVCCNALEQDANADYSCTKTECTGHTTLGCCGLHAISTGKSTPPSSPLVSTAYDNSGLTALCGFNQFQRDYVQCTSNEIEVTSCTAVFDRASQEQTLLDVLQKDTVSNSPVSDHVSLRSCLNIATVSNASGICIPKNSDPYNIPQYNDFRKPSLEERNICASRVQKISSVSDTSIKSTLMLLKTNNSLLTCHN